ncbi:MAG TPA: RNase adapter RapZ [Candidatus Saccharimonadales bacterium]|jgi:aminoglycoside/choline kinase family phosphotransferase|nr:RNase adapter RapZ [Candidatus Saccharimonadales bacterium]
MDVLRKLFELHFRSPAERVQRLQGSLGGSGRNILRLTAGRCSAIGVLYAVREENVAFLEFSRHFRRHGLPVPEIYGEELEHGAYLEEDLGDTTLFEFLSQNRTGDAVAPAVVEAYRQVVAMLPRFQVEAGKDLNYEVCYPRAAFDRQSIAWDLNYFKYHFLRLADVPFNEQGLEDDFACLTEFLLGAGRDYFLYRDFQSRNVMLRDGRPFFVDYQGGRKGALQYDIASLLYDAKADLPPDLRRQLLDHYLESLAGFIDTGRDVFLRHYYAFVYVRIMQALGAYGFRGFYERKPHFLQSVPYALKNLRWLLQNAELPVKLPALMEAFRSMIDSEKLHHLAPAMEAPASGNPQGVVSERPLATHSGEAMLVPSAPAALTVRIFSFSFHQSPPQDETGNGGGFVFDARSLPNPAREKGREAHFKALTGQDAPVIDYLHQHPNVHQYLAGVWSLVETSVSNYQQRGFKSLMVSFGCTGGQHRSVYLAEQLAQRLRARTGVQVVVRHLQLEKLKLEKLQPENAACQTLGQRS